MRTLLFDYLEHDPPDSEQTLHIAIAPIRQFKDADEFLAACPLERANLGKVASPQSQPLRDVRRLPEVLANLSEYANFSLPREDPSTATVLHDEWDELTILIQTPGHWVCYHWYTTA